MINKLVSSAIAQGVIQQEDAEVYAYSYYTLFVKVAMWVAVFVLGALFDRLLGTLLFMAFLVPLRQYAGGFHLKSPKACFAWTLFIFATIIGLSWLPVMPYLKAAFLPAVLFSAVAIWVIGPQDDANKPATQNELRFFGKMARLIAAIECCLIAVGVVLAFPAELLFFAACGTVLSGVLVVVRGVPRLLRRPK